MTLLIRKHPQLEMENNPMPGREVFSNAVSTIGFFIALIVGVLVPAINFYALLIILLTVPLQRVYDRRSAAARLAPAAQSS
ncbi:hypothetical protein ABH924_004542 [Arthrobacter sp. GAS37]|uniref:hypothetical protein n=1 Tax=Arthrobacter sp. GAS37 TaxID=3156261 RepID=UPI003835EE90